MDFQRTVEGPLEIAERNLFADLFEDIYDLLLWYQPLLLHLLHNGSYTLIY